MSWVKQIFFFHFAEYSIAIKKQVIDKKQRLSEFDLPKQRKFEKVDLCVETAEKDISKFPNKLQWFDFITILMKGELK